MLHKGLCRNTDRYIASCVLHAVSRGLCKSGVKRAESLGEHCLQAESKREAKMQKLLGSRDALKHRIHDHIQKQTLALQEADSKVGRCYRHPLTS